MRQGSFDKILELSKEDNSSSSESEYEENYSELLEENQKNMENIQKGLENKKNIKNNLFKKLSVKLQNNLAKPNLDNEFNSDDVDINEKSKSREALMINLMPEGTSPKGEIIFSEKKNIKIMKKKSSKTHLKSSKIEKDKKIYKSNSKNFVIDNSNIIFKTGELENKFMKKKKNKIFKSFNNTRGKSAKTNKKKKNNMIFSSRGIFQKKNLFEEHKSFISIKQKKTKKKKMKVDQSE